MTAKTNWKRFERRGWTVDPVTDCWATSYCLGYGGHALFSQVDETGRRSNIYAHEFVWRHFFGDVPDGQKVAQLCGTKVCVNPQHLELRTTLKICTAAGCDLRAIARGLCSKHYVRWKKYGTTTAPNTRFHKDMTDEDRLRHRGWVVTDRGCWEWSGGRYPDHYGFLTDQEGRTAYAHRLAYRTWVGPIPEGKIIRHRCDNPPCINPEHLLVGTAKDNARDRLEHGQAMRGHSNPASRLTEENVREILSSSETTRGLARKFGVYASTVRDVRKGRSWTHLQIDS